MLLIVYTLTNKKMEVSKANGWLLILIKNRNLQTQTTEMNNFDWTYDPALKCYMEIIPCFATITLETASGTLVPAAKNVIPITESGIFKVSPGMTEKEERTYILVAFSVISIGRAAERENLPTIVIIQATKYDNEPIQMMHIRNVIGNRFLNRPRSQFGMVNQ